MVSIRRGRAPASPPLADENDWHRVVDEYKAEDRSGTDDAAPDEANRRDWINPQRHLKRVFYWNVAPKGVALPV